MDNKKRVLLVNEASFLNTGFSTIGKEIMSRLWETGKYELAELGSYAKSSDPRAYELPWKFYGGIPEDHDEFGQSRYRSSIHAQFGEWCFEDVCLDFNCDICLDIRDNWMSAEWLLKSPFRPYIHYVIMPTVDGEPQRYPWLDDYANSDTVLTYTDYGKRTLEKEAPGRVNVHGVVRPGVNHEQYRPLGQKEEIRKTFGINPEWKIFLTVMRNQPRKLFPNLFDAFKLFLDKCEKEGNHELANKSFLYLHTSYPDVGFDIGKLLLERGLGNKVIMTYVCQSCGHFYPSFFSTEISNCPKCNKISAQMPNTHAGLSRDQLVYIYNIADIYVQYSTCEGLSLPSVESRACGLPTMAVDYSATSDQGHEPGSVPINVEKFFYEAVSATEQMRALPDNNDTVEKMYKLITMPEKDRIDMGMKGREYVSKNYSFDRAAKIFEEAIDQAPVVDAKKTWLNPTPNLPPMNFNVPQFSTNAELVDWCFDNILGEPRFKKTHWRTDLIKGLNVGYIPVSNSQASQRKEMNRDILIDQMRHQAEKKYYYEKLRVNSLDPDKPQGIFWEKV